MSNTGINGRPVKAEFYSKFSIHDASDLKRCKVNRMVCLSDGRLVVMDIGNFKIKLFSDEFIPVASADVPPLCCSLAVVDDTTVAIAGENKICFAEITEEGIKLLHKEITVDTTVFDILRINKKFLCLAKKVDTNYLLYLEDNGNTRELVKLPPGELTFSNSISINKDGTYIYFNDDYSPKFNITCYSIKGQVKWRLHTDWMPACLTVIKERLLISDYARHEIRHVTVDGVEDKEQVLGEEQDVHYPHALAYQSTKERLLVSSRKHNQDVVTVFSLLD